MAGKTKSDPQTRILNAAENAFANEGFEGASLRHIVLEAKVNLPTVYYYFKSKEGLLLAVMNRRFGPVRAESFQLLKEFEAETKGRPLPLERVLEAIIAPALHLATNKSANSGVAMRLLGRIVTDPQIHTLKTRSGHDELREVFLTALHKALPKLSMCDLRWRAEFFWGALSFILINPRKLEGETESECNPLDTKTAQAAMVNFFSAGFRAPALSKSKCKT